MKEKKMYYIYAAIVSLIVLCGIIWSMITVLSQRCNTSIEKMIGQMGYTTWQEIQLDPGGTKANSWYLVSDGREITIINYARPSWTSGVMSEYVLLKDLRDSGKTVSPETPPIPLYYETENRESRRAFLYFLPGGRKVRQDMELPEGAEVTWQTGEAGTLVSISYAYDDRSADMGKSFGNKILEQYAEMSSVFQE